MRSLMGSPIASDIMLHSFNVGELTEGRVIAAWELAGHVVVRKLHCVFLALYILFISIIVVIFLFLCCSVKLSLS